MRPEKQSVRTRGDHPLVYPPDGNKGRAPCKFPQNRRFEQLLGDYRRSTHQIIPAAISRNSALGVIAEKNGGQLLMTPRLENSPFSM